MRLVIRRSFMAIFLLVYGALSLGGPGALHALPGWSHDSGFTPSSKNDHSHGPGKTAHQVSEDCLICQLINDRPISADSFVPLVGFQLETKLALLEAPKPSHSIRLVKNSRGPPATTTSPNTCV